MRRSGACFPWQTCTKPPFSPSATCSAAAITNQFLFMAASLCCRRREHAQTMAIGIERYEGVAKIHGGGLLGDRQAAPLPIGMGELNLGGIGDGERDFAAAWRRSHGFDITA